MEAIIGLIVVVLFFAGISIVFRALGAAGRAALGKGSFSDNFEASFGFAPLDVRLIEKRIGDSRDGPKGYEVQAKGLLPLQRRQRVGFITSVFDSTGEDFAPVISLLDVVKEPGSNAYQNVVELGPTDPGIGFVGWARVGAVLPAVLEPPYGGKRKFSVAVRLVDLDNPPKITHGFNEPNDPGIIWQKVLSFEHTVQGNGYIGAANERDRARPLCLQMALSIAMWDGELSDVEGKKLKIWIQRILDNSSGHRREKLKSDLNNAMREGYNLAKQGNLSLSKIADELNQIDELSIKYEAIELCFEVVKSNKQIAADQVRMINIAASALNLDLKEIERMRDLRILSVPVALDAPSSTEDLLGIDSSWTKEKARRHLTAEFQKWNNRITSLPEGAERDTAQRMLDAIAAARRKYE